MLPRRIIMCVAALVISGCAETTKTIRPNWQNPGHRLVAQQLVPLLRAGGRDQNVCKVFFIETENLNAVSLGECTFGFTTGLADTGDAKLIVGVAAHEVAHDVLGHADKRKAAIATEQLIRTGVSLIPGVGGLIASSAILVAGMLALPAYSRSQEAEADDKAVEILLAAGDADAAGTMIHAFRVLLARHGAKGGGLLDTHPGTEDRLEAMRKRQLQQPAIEAPAPTVMVREERPDIAAPPMKSPDSALEGGAPGQPPSGGTVEGPTGKIEPSSSLKPTDRNPAGSARGILPRGVTEIEQLGPGVTVAELSRMAQTAVVFVYREGSPYSERMEELINRVAGRFAGRARLFRSEVSRTATDLVGPTPNTTPILIVFRNGREHARITGLPAKRRPGTPADEALAEWLTDHLKGADD
jgi:hypothetical protein